MNDPVCDRIRLAAMARLDGEPAMAGPEGIAAPLRGCAACAGDLAELEARDGLLRGKARRPQPVDLWAGLAPGLDPSSAPEAHPWRWPVFAWVALLVVCRVLDLQIGLQVQLVAKLLTLVAGGALLARAGSRANPRMPSKRIMPYRLTKSPPCLGPRLLPAA